MITHLKINKMKNLSYKTMRRLVLAMLILMNLSMSAQNYIVKFMGVPVDGSETEFVSKLKKKGFKWNYEMKCLEGRFNGNDVMLHIQTNNDKVWRVGVVDHDISDTEANIRVRFNKLLDQFENNNRYITLSDNEKIEYGEDISYEIMVHNKRYEASFIQMPSDDELVELYNDADYFYNWLSGQFSEKELDSLQGRLKDDFDERIANHFYRLHRLDAMLSNSVWFTIFESYGKYGIIIFYENRYNEANGEDL